MRLYIMDFTPRPFFPHPNVERKKIDEGASVFNNDFFGLETIYCKIDLETWKGRCHKRFFLFS